MKPILLLLVAASFCAITCDAPITASAATRSSESTHYHGLNFVAPPRPFETDPMLEVKSVSADWVAVIPYAFTREGQPVLRYNPQGKQWWGERPDGVRKTIELAHAAGVKVMVKPQVFVPGSWTGKLDFESDSAWQAWEAGYRDYILLFADLAAEMDVDLFCVGTEFKISAKKREAFWRELIREVRTRFPGKITYAANWDDYPEMPFWDAVDFIGIDAYFPLSDNPTPTVKELVKAWEQPKQAMKAFSQQKGKPIVFTEYGYLTVDGCAGKTWELEAKIDNLAINEQAQANALAALWQVFHKESWWKGGFLWKWFPEMRGHEGYPEKDYTPQGKMAEKVLREWHEK